MSPQNVIQGKYVLGSKSVVGDPRRRWEDRAYVGEIQRPNDDSLIVGVVADGVGSADFGARGAQLAIDTVTASLQTSRGDDIPALIDSAMNMANTVVYDDNQKNAGDGLTTLVVAVIHNDRCYVGNVGDSRAYWAKLPVDGKPGRTLQLTRDHSYYNIYGGDKNSQEANVVVNAIGKKPKIEVDCGFYLKKNDDEKDDLEKAYQLGLAGLPLKPGDSIVLCSDGLIKDSPTGTPYITPKEILDALQSEYEPDRAAIKMVGQAEGRRPDDNVSAVTIQYLSRQLVSDIKARSEQAKLTQMLIRVGLGVLALFAVILIGSLSYGLIKEQGKPTSTPIFITNTPVPTPTITPTVVPGQAMVQGITGGSANVKDRQILLPGAEISSQNAGIRIVVGQQSGKSGVMYWFANSVGKVDFDAYMMKPLLSNGPLYIQPGSGSAEIHFAQPDIIASVSGSRMIVEVKVNEIIVYCFEGKCRLDVGIDGKIIPVKNSLSYNIKTQQWFPSNGEIPYDEQWDWNIRCNRCMDDIIPSPTPTPTVPPTSGEGQASPTKRKPQPRCDNNGTPVRCP